MMTGRRQNVLAGRHKLIAYVGHGMEATVGREPADDDAALQRDPDADLVCRMQACSPPASFTSPRLMVRVRTPKPSAIVYLPLSSLISGLPMNTICRTLVFRIWLRSCTAGLGQRQPQMQLSSWPWATSGCALRGAVRVWQAAFGGLPSDSGTTTGQPGLTHGGG